MLSLQHNCFFPIFLLLLTLVFSSIMFYVNITLSQIFVFFYFHILYVNSWRRVGVEEGTPRGLIRRVSQLLSKAYYLVVLLDLGKIVWLLYVHLSDYATFFGHITEHEIYNIRASLLSFSICPTNCLLKASNPIKSCRVI